MTDQSPDNNNQNPASEPHTVTSQTHIMRKRILLILVGVVLVIVASVGARFLVTQQGGEKISTAVTNIYKPTGVFASNFATYTETSVSVHPNVASYTVNPDLSNITNLADVTLSDEAKKLLVKNAFVVSQSKSPEFFPMYESNRYSYIPNFVTTDSMLHNYHLMFDFILKKLEEEKLAPELKSLSASMLSGAVSQYDNLKGTEWENAAKRNVAFFAVGSKLIDPTVDTPSIAKNEVDQELALIAAHQGINESPVINIGASVPTPVKSGVLSLEALKEDYSQYVPRGHYDKSEQLKAYFKSMMWYGRLTFRLKNDDEIKSGILITLSMDKENNRVGWNKIYEPVNFFVGKSDDITYYQFKDLLKKSYGDTATLQTVTASPTQFAAFVGLTKTLEAPQINSIPIFNAAIQPDREKEIKGFRFMGQRFTIDASIFQRLVDREVPNRLLPKGLDIPAAFGSTEALNILTDAGETKYENYSTNMTTMKAYLNGLPVENWTQNVYWSWLYALRPLTEAKSTGYPPFMQNAAWSKKEVNTFMGSWTELKHDTILYSKQVYAEMGGGPPDAKDDRGYVEPNPYVFARLASLLKMTNEGLETRGLLSDAMKDNLSKMEQLALSLKTISEKELNSEKLSDADYELIRSYGGQLEHFWLEVNKEEMAKQQLNQINYLDQNPAAIVADVATDPNGQALEEATGYISNVYVVVPVEGKLRIAAGGLYSYYEFARPLSDRLTDQQWRDILQSDQVPPMPSWTSAFLSK